MARLQLDFVGKTSPRLHQTVFYPFESVPKYLDKSFKCVYGRGKGRFSWGHGSMALCYFLLDYICWSKRKSRSSKSVFVREGEYNSPVKTLDYAMGQALNWMEGMFGVSEGTNDCRLHEYIKRLNPEKKVKNLPFGLQIDTDIFPASSITINWANEEVTDVETLDGLAEAIAEQWFKQEKYKNDWKEFKAQRRQNAEKEQAVAKQKQTVKTRKPKATEIVLGVASNPIADPQLEWPDNKLIDKSIYYPVIDGKPSCVNKQDLVQYRGRFIKGYLSIIAPNTNLPMPYEEEEWLDADCTIVLSNHLLKESLKHVLCLFQHDEIGLEEWSKRRIANAIWSNLEWQEELPRRLASASPRLQQIWNQECAKYFPDIAQEIVSLAINPVSTQEPPTAGIENGNETV